MYNSAQTTAGANSNICQAAGDRSYSRSPPRSIITPTIKAHTEFCISNMWLSVTSMDHLIHSQSGLRSTNIYRSPMSVVGLLQCRRSFRKFFSKGERFDEFDGEQHGLTCCVVFPSLVLILIHFGLTGGFEHRQSHQQQKFPIKHLCSPYFYVLY